MLPQQYRLRGASSDLSVYEGTVAIVVPLQAPSGASGAAASDQELVLEGRLRYQACNPRRCLRPSSVAVRLPVRIVVPAAASAR